MLASYHFLCGVGCRPPLYDSSIKSNKFYELGLDHKNFFLRFRFYDDFVQRHVLDTAVQVHYDDGFGLVIVLCNGIGAVKDLSELVSVSVDIFLYMEVEFISVFHLFVVLSKALLEVVSFL